MADLEKRQFELERQSTVAAIEATCLTLEIGETKTFELKDLVWCY